MNFHLIADIENQYCAQCGKNEASRVVSFVRRARKHVRNAAADDGSENAKNDRPEDRHVNVHHRFRDDACD